MSNNAKHSLINLIAVSSGLILSYTILYGGSNMFGLDNNSVAIVVALITVAGSLIAHWFLFKRDSGTIGAVKADTSEMKPVVADTNQIVKTIRDTTFKDMLPMIKTVEDAKNGVNALVDELNFQKRLRDMHSSQISNKDFLINGITEIYEQNVKLEKENRELMASNRLLELKNNTLNKENAQLHSQITELEKELISGDRSLEL